MENSELYKEKYLRYKKDYLILKNQTSGANMICSQYSIFFILDSKTYDKITEHVKYYESGLNYYKEELAGSALILSEGSQNVTFIEIPNISSLKKRVSKATSTTYSKATTSKYKFSNTQSTANNIVKLSRPYNYGDDILNPLNINKLADNIKSKLQKLDESVKDYKEISESSSAFYGIFIFKALKSDCNLIQAYKLVDSVENQLDVITFSDGKKKVLQLDNIVPSEKTNNIV